MKSSKKLLLILDADDGRIAADDRIGERKDLVDNLSNTVFVSRMRDEHEVDCIARFRTTLLN